jgi:hypothetical protein
MGTAKWWQDTNSESDEGQSNVRTILSPSYSYFVYVRRIRERWINFDVALTSLQYEMGIFLVGPSVVVFILVGLVVLTPKY